jgi:hypothetical protein
LRKGLLTLLVLLAAAAPASAACPTEPTFDPSVPTWEAVNGFELGSRQASYSEVVKYLDAVAVASQRVVGGELAQRSWGNRALPYVAVSDPASVEEKRLSEIGRTMRAIRAAQTKPARVRAIARRTPAIATVSANVHGDEPSGTDASMKLLYELAARTDCANVQRLERLVTFILPIQNPDGREAGTRENGYGFDLNRDWFARTQPETEGKIALLRRFPPILFIDAHEQVGTAYFFPPNADPIHHEVSAEALTAINETYAPAMRAAAEREGFDYTNYTTYDLFFMGYGDTVPSTAFGSAGMTFEKGGQSPYTEKAAEQFATQDATLTVAAQKKRHLLELWARQWPRATSQGRRGVLEPNLVVQPENEVRFQVPSVKVFGYFIRADRSLGDAVRLARRLRSLGVRVYRLRRDSVLRGAHRYGVRGFRSERLPAGTFWIPAAQPQKHWIQAIMGEDSYVPFPYFYDVSGWSNPLLMGLSGGYVARPNRRVPVRRWRSARSLGSVRGTGPAWSFQSDSTSAYAFALDALRAGARVVRSPKSTLVAGISRAKVARLARARDVVLAPGSVDPPPRYSVDLKRPKVAVLENLVALSGASSGFTEFVLERRLGIETDVLTSAQIDAGALTADGYTALVVPAGELPTGGLTPSGLAQIQLFVRRGGRYVGFSRPGLFVAAASGLTLATERPAPSDYQVPGASFRVLIDDEKVKPLSWGIDEETFVFNVGDPIIEPSAQSSVGASYPDDSRFFSSGYTEGADALRGTPVAISEEVGSGQAVVFSFDANFRAYTDSTIRLFANAVLHPVAGEAAQGGFRLRPALLARAASAQREAVIRVPLAAEAQLRAAAASFRLPAGARITRDLSGASLRVPGGRAIDGGEAMWPRHVLEQLRRAGVRPNLLVL